ncbi:uncharacterized protein LOC126878567 [Diabrotica virgifera virgifera]|uniref:RNA-directed DNA polymerase from transposon X-element n=1 Tax=Diabrotica virgifera virgifera TaxID=50390 RepID=A0ABM5JHA0_DIAVI|nr:uncharacterized protein LOC126878567 [Diabrotica virgifera virgifera]
MQKMRNQALNRYRRSRNPEHWNYYKQIRNLITSTIRREKKIYLNNKLQNCNIKEKWNELRKINVLNRKQNHIPDNLKDVNKLNQHFTAACSINQQPSNELLSFYRNHSMPVQEPFRFNTVSMEDVADIILSVKSKAFGQDDLNITLIQLCCPFIVPFITHIVNSCIIEFYFPASWKRAKIIPLPKIKNPTEFNHLRCISILPTFSKIIEKIIEKQMSNFLEKK